ncbi:MAG: hypothetical protein U0354_10290 [Candidatus Sericytochromatia bacterium]
MKRLVIIFTIFTLFLNINYVFAYEERNELEYVNKMHFFEYKLNYEHISYNLDEKKPWYLSFILPGFGQILLEEKPRGLIYLIPFALFMNLIISVRMNQLDKDYQTYLGNSRGEGGILPPYVVYGVLISLLGVIYILNLIDLFFVLSNDNEYIDKINYQNGNVTYKAITF